MANQKVMSYISNRHAILGTGDTMLGYGANMQSLTNNNGGSIVIGAPVYSVSAGNVDKAKSDALATSEVIGCVADVSISASAVGNIQTRGTVTATTGQWDAVAGTSGGLAANTIYYLDPATAGKITSTAPTTVGQLVVRIGKALSTTQLELDISFPVLL